MLKAFKIIFIVSILSCILIFLHSTQFDWTKFPPAYCIVNGNCHCEYDYIKSFIREIINSISSLGFLLVGLYIYFFAKPKKEINKLIFLLLSVFTTVGSIAFHATLTSYGIALDNLGIFAIMAYIVLSKTGIQKFYRTILVISFFIFGNFIFLISNFAYKYDFISIIFTILFAVYLILREYKLFKWDRYIWLGIISHTLAYTCWQLDHYRFLCDPFSIIQFHSLWHLFASGTMLMVYYYCEDTMPKLTSNKTN